MIKTTNDPYWDESVLYDPQAWNTVSRLDAWVGSSLMQKSIRRCDTPFAAVTGLRYHQLRGAAVWSRLMLIAVEDIGIASPPTLAHVANMARLARRHEVGDNILRAVASVAEILAGAPKDRSADYLISAAVAHPAFENERCFVGKASADQRIAMAVDLSLPLITRGIAAWFASGRDHTGESRVGEGNLPQLMEAFVGAGVPDSLLAAVTYICSRVRHPITIMLPVLWMEAFGSNASGLPRVTDMACPGSPLIGGMPAYALDKHTSSGKAAITQFAAENNAVADVLSRRVPDFRAADVAAMGAFYTDAIPIRPQLFWHGTTELERLGREADFAKIGYPIEAIDELIAAIADNLDHLNVLRAKRFSRRFGKGETCDA
ncbi:hypothetical protein [Brucella ciceri]|uniref:hypothetical protein n=1 Tax=Brucella ciceri TaxID=391287 RepID=UPI0035BBE855